jgi:hypothetical protein
VKNRDFNVLIHMGASKFDVTVKNAKRENVTFDLYHMNKDERRNFQREFMKAYRAS